MKRNGKILLMLCLMVACSRGVATSKEIESNDSTALVKESWEEQRRKEIVEVLGDLTKYLVIWIHPENFEVGAIRNLGKDEFEVVYWRRGLRKEEVKVAGISPDDANVVLRAMNAMLEEAKAAKAGDQDEDFTNPDRIFFFQRYKNVDVWDWNSVGVRTNSTDEHFKLIMEKMNPSKD